MNGLETIELRSPSLVQRLFRRKVGENALCALQNIIAKTPLSELPLDALERLLGEYDLSREDADEGLARIYCTVFEDFLSDAELSDPAVSGLMHLRRVLGLGDSAAQALEGPLLAAKYRAAVQASLADGVLSTDERTRLATLARSLRLPEELRHNIWNAEASALYTKALEDVIGDSRLSPEEDSHLAALAEQLDVKIKYDDTTRQALERHRTLWRLDQGELPVVPVPVLLQRAETCHAAIPAARLELRTRTRRIRYGGPTARVRIMKGVYWRMGDLAVSRVTDDVWVPLGTGTLYITSKRLIFDGDARTTSIALNRILDFTVYKDGILIDKDSGKSQLFKADGDLELLGATLHAAVAASRA